MHDHRRRVHVSQLAYQDLVGMHSRMVNNKDVDDIEIIEMLLARSTIHIHTHILVPICIPHCTPSSPIQCPQRMPQAVPSIPHQSPQSPGNPHRENMVAAWGLPNLGNGQCHGEGLRKLGAKACSLSVQI